MHVRRRPARNAAGLAQQLVVMLGMSVLSGVLLAGVALPWAGVLSLSAHRGEEIVTEDLPLQLETSPSPERTRIMTSGGKLLATLYDENRVELDSLEDIAPVMQQAIISIEDERFYQHGAMDIKGTIRALVANQSSGDIVQGGSTITQQLVKMTLIEQADTEKERLEAIDDTYARKLKELRYALGVEEDKTKDEILLDYLNIAYFGDGAYGIEAAAQHYFGVSAKDLNLRQAAMLAGVVKNPTELDPTNNRKKAEKRRNVVLQRMATLKKIPQQRADKASQKALGLDVHPTPNGCVATNAEFFCDYVRNWLLTQRSLGKTRDDRERLILRGGLTVKTTIDLRFQRAAERAVRNHVDKRDMAIGGVAMVEPGTGKVKGIAQSRPMGNEVKKGETYLNYLVPQEYSPQNGGFQPGSTFKAFTLAAAIEKGFRMNETIYSPESLTLQQDLYEKSTCPRKNLAGSWTVSNSTESGPMNMYTGTQLSVNTYFAQLELKTGICKPWRLAKQMGIRDPGPQHPSWTLGVSGVAPLEMAEAYATFAARGVHCDAIPVTEVLDRNGNQVAIDGAKCGRVIKRSTADAVNDVLRGVIADGGFADDQQIGQPAAGKTGTHSENKAVWFMGYTPDLATASMLAGANRQGHQITLNGLTVGGEYISSASGSGNAAPIWGDAMRAVAQWLPNRDFRKPNAVSVNGVRKTVPSLGGMTPGAAKKQLENRGFIPFVQREYMVNSEYSYGTVAYTSPGAYSTAYSGDTVTIFISNGTPPPPPPEDDGGDGGGNGGGGNGGGGGGNGNGGNGGGNDGGNDGGGGDGDDNNGRGNAGGDGNNRGGGGGGDD